MSSARETNPDSSKTTENTTENQPKSLFETTAVLESDPNVKPASAMYKYIPEAGSESHIALIGKTIGRYQIQAELGVGGMGAVYLAEQRQSVRRQVALKVIKAGMDSEEVIARFQSERALLAMMNHPRRTLVFRHGIRVRRAHQ